MVAPLPWQRGPGGGLLVVTMFESDRLPYGSEIRTANVRSGSGVPLRPMQNRSFAQDLVPTISEYPVLVEKRSPAWSITE